MTYVFIDVSETAATVATDTWQISDKIPEIKNRRKLFVDEPRRMAIVGNGLGAPAVFLHEQITTLDPDATRFPHIDEALIAGSQTVLERFWDLLPAGTSGGTVWQVGFAPTLGRFVIVEYSSNNRPQWAPRVLAERTIVQPTPPGYEAGIPEKASLLRGLNALKAAGRMEDAYELAHNMKTVTHGEPVPSGMGLSDVVRFAEFVRATRTRIPGRTMFKVHFGGHLDVATLSRTEVSVTRAHTFDDSEDRSVVLGDVLAPDGRSMALALG